MDWSVWAPVLAGLAGSVFTVVIMSWKDGHIKGKQAKTISAMEETIVEIKAEILKIPIMEGIIELHTERLNSQTREHDHLETSIEDLSKNINANTVSNAALKATLEGIQVMLQNIISGNLIMRQ